MLDRFHDLSCPGQGRIKIVGVDDVEPGDVLFDSTKGPSVMTTSPALTRTTVVARGSWRAPPNTNVPLASISASRAATRFTKVCISSGVLGDPGVSPSMA
jgi:hypothetical protein